LKTAASSSPRSPSRNSKWAHGASLAVASSIDDNTLSDELRLLGASYDFSVVSHVEWAMAGRISARFFAASSMTGLAALSVNRRARLSAISVLGQPIATG
jgi:hypothetical protein